MIVNEKGTLVSKGEVVTGTSKTTGKAWKKQEIVVEIPGAKYPRNLALTTMSESVITSIADVQPKEKVEVGYEPSSSLWNSRWYTDLRLVSLNRLEPKPAQNDEDLPF